MTGSPSLRALLDEGVAEGAFVGAAAAVGTPETVVTAARGFEDEVGGDPVSEATRFDAASLTKSVVTTTVFARLAERGAVRADASLSEYVPPLSGTARGGIALRDLLTHTSGLPPYKAFPFGWESSDALLDSLYRTPLGLLAEPGEWFVYSDLSFVHLADALRRATGESLADLADRHVFEPLDMETASLGPLDATENVAATRDYRWRNRRLRGDIHDYIGTVMGGESGNAGLFATVGDYANVAQMLLDGGVWEGSRVLSEDSVARLTTDQTPPGMRPHGLGWRLRHDGEPSTHWSTETFGHTGFTGTSLWVDPAHARFAVLLTNKLLTGESNEAFPAFKTRFHDAVASNDAALIHDE